MVEQKENIVGQKENVAQRQVPVNMQEQLRKVQEAANKSIFRETQKRKPGRIETWIKQKVIDYLKRTDPYEHRFMRVHHRAKSKGIHIILRFIQKRMGGYAINGLEDIPAESYNNHLRIFYWCWDRSLEDFWKKFVYCLPGRVDKKKFPTEDVFYEQILKSRDTFQDKDSHARRILLIKLWMTEILEDTADREWLNMFMLRLYHTLHDHYKGQVPYPGDQPLYDSGVQFNPNYFMAWSQVPLWMPPERKKEEEL